MIKIMTSHRIAIKAVKIQIVSLLKEHTIENGNEVLFKQGLSFPNLGNSLSELQEFIKPKRMYIEKDCLMIEYKVCDRDGFCDEEKNESALNFDIKQLTSIVELLNEDF